MRILPLLLITILIASCEQLAKVRPQYTIGFSQCCIDEWRAMMEDEMQRELAFHEGVNLIIKAASNDNDEQIAHIKEFQNMGVDLMVIAPNETEPLSSIVDEIYASGIPVILIDRKTKTANYNAFIGANNYDIGLTAAEYIASNNEGDINIVELQLPLSISPAVGRSQGFKDGVDQFDNLTIVDSKEIDLLNQTPNFLKEAFERFPSINAVYCHTDLLAKESKKTLIDLQREKDVSIYGIDGLPGPGGGVAAVEEGVIDATFLYPTGGKEAIKLAMDILNRQPYSRDINLPTTVIDPSNVRMMRLQNEKILAQQEDIERQQMKIVEQERVYRNQRTALLIIISSLILSLFLGGLAWKSLRVVKEKNRKISEMSDKAQLASQSTFRFFTNIAHELKTPLTLIFGSVEDLLSANESPHSRSRDAQMIRKNASRLLGLVNQLLDLRKIESHKMKIQVVENDIITFVKEIMTAYEKIAVKNNIEFRLIHDDPSLIVWFDYNMMDKVLFNLISNAFKFTNDNGEISITIRKSNTNDKAIIQVRDSGKGMTQAQADQVFDRFYSAENYSKGTGLGLSLSKELIELHRGTIRVDSKTGEGANFIIELPLGKSHFLPEEIVEHPLEILDHQNYQLLQVEENGNRPPLKVDYDDFSQPTLLLIDDSVDLTDYLNEKLKDHYQIDVATEGNTGIRKALEYVPDLIISDIVMPGLSGLQITQKLKNDIRTSHIPIILLTGKSAIEHQIEGLQSGADAYITKPFAIDLLHEKVKRLLINRQILKEHYSKGVLHQEISPVNPVDDEFVVNFMSIVQENYMRSDFGVPDICQEIGLSRSQLYRKVKALMGQNISDYIQKVRLKTGRDLLLNSNLSIAEIAYQVGYSSPDYFSTSFKNMYEMSPTSYKASQSAHDG